MCSLFLVSSEPGIDSGRHGGDSGNGSLDIKTQTCIADSLCGGAAETADDLLALNKVRSVLLERFDSCRAEEYQHIVIIKFTCCELVAYGTVHYSLGMGNLIGIKKFLEFTGMNVGHRYEITLCLMLEDRSHEAVYLTGIAEEHLTLAVLDILLDVERHGLGDAEILHVLRDVYSHLGAKLEEMVNSVT